MVTGGKSEGEEPLYPGQEGDDDGVRWGPREVEGSPGENKDGHEREDDIKGPEARGHEGDRDEGESCKEPPAPPRGLAQQAIKLLRTKHLAHGVKSVGHTRDVPTVHHPREGHIGKGGRHSPLDQLSKLQEQT